MTDQSSMEVEQLTLYQMSGGSYQAVGDNVIKLSWKFFLVNYCGKKPYFLDSNTEVNYCHSAVIYCNSRGNSML